MKIHCIIGLYVIFIVALLFGFNSGTSIGNPGNDLANVYSTSLAASKGSQYNILLIQVDQMDKVQPHLESVWLMAYYANTPRVDLLPIYSTKVNGPLEQGYTLPHQFNLTESGEPGESFWLELQKINTWWNGYIMMDGIAAQTLTTQLSEPSDDVQDLGTDEINLPNNSLNSTGTQVEQYQKLCQDFSINSKKAGFFNLYFSMKGNIRSNLKLSHFYRTWRLLSSYGSELQCNFPSLRASVQ
jgi:hypothetical protein